VLVHGVTASTRTWWRVGPWFAENGWRAVAVDLRGHGASPRMQGGEALEDLAEDLHETLSGLPDADGIDVLLGHSLGALVVLKLCQDHGQPARRLVLEEPPGSEGTDFGEVAREMQASALLARGSPEEAVRRTLAENPALAEEDAKNSVAGLLDCDAAPVATFLRTGLRYDLTELVGSVAVPTLLVLGSEESGSMLSAPERAAVAGSLPWGTVEELDAGHGVHRDDFEGYVRLLGSWLGGPVAEGSRGSGRRARLETFTAETFSEHLGTTFRIYPSAESPLGIELISVTELGEEPERDVAGHRRPFSILFRGTRDVLLPQRIYRIEHAEIGSFEIFLVPIGPDDKGHRYEAIFT
jgi:pimeloyl-ACP methyl ester carboxylesterase